MTYTQQLKEAPEALAYLREERGLSDETIHRFALGYVTENNRVVIPYTTFCPVKGMVFHKFKYRAIDDSTPKYLEETGSKDRIFNPFAFLEPSPVIAVCEGEIDCMSAVQLGIPAIGIAGVSKWQTYYKRLFRGYDAIYILQDKGQPGEKFAKQVKQDLPSAIIVPMDDDVNSDMRAIGEEQLRERILNALH